MHTFWKYTISSAAIAAALIACGAEQQQPSDETAGAESVQRISGESSGTITPNAGSEGGETTDLPEGEVEPPTTDEFAGLPDGTDTLAALLRARHTEDLPSADDLRSYPDAATSLLWVEANATHMFERTRALSLMRHVPTDEVLARLSEVATDESEHQLARTAAQESLDAVAE